MMGGAFDYSEAHRELRDLQAAAPATASDITAGRRRPFATASLSGQQHSGLYRFLLHPAGLAAVVPERQH